MISDETLGLINAVLALLCVAGFLVVLVLGAIAVIVRLL